MTKVKEKELKSLYLIYGTERLLLEEALQRLKGRFAKEADMDFNSDVFDGETATGYEIVQSAETLPFMSGKRLVVVRNTDKLSGKAEELIAKYAENPSETTCLVLVSSKVNQKSKVYKAISKKGEVFEYKPPKKGEYPKWVQSQFLKQNKSITDRAARYLSENLAYDMEKLSNEIEKFCLYYADQSKIDLSEVEVFSLKAPENTIFELIDAVSAKSKSLSLKILNNLLNNNENFTHIFYAMIRHFKLLLKTKDLVERGMDGAELINQLKVHPFVVKKCREQAKNFTLKQLKSAYDLLAEIDLSIKRGEKDPHLIFENLIVSICSKEQKI
jgi:DNA polymerase-3 subunit delta